MRIQFPEDVLEAICQLNKAGYEAYAVGGCVRDSLLGREPHDWDITTSALPEQVKAVFAKRPVIDTGIQHGTVTLVSPGGPLEITTYRVDGVYSDSRRPDSVSFTRSLREDLARRDFTINAMACHPEKGLADCFHGERDLRAGLVRCVGEPDRRFGEDALRILRALRFSSALGFDIEKETADSLLKNRGNLRHIAAERIFSELKRLLCGKDALRVLLAFPQVLWVFLPELEPLYGFNQLSPYHLYDIWEHTARSVSFVQPDETLRLAMLLHDIGKPACFTVDGRGQGHFKGHPAVSAALTEKILGRLRADHETRNRVLTLVTHHDVTIPASRAAVRRWLGKLGEEAFFQLIQVKTADNLAQNRVYDRTGEYEALAGLARDIIREQDCFSLKQLAVNGRDLLAAGFPAGPGLGALLHTLLERVMEGSCPNEKDALLAAAKELRP